MVEMTVVHSVKGRPRSAKTFIEAKLKEGCKIKILTD